MLINLRYVRQCLLETRPLCMIDLLNLGRWWVDWLNLLSLSRLEVLHVITCVFVCVCAAAYCVSPCPECNTNECWSRDQVTRVEIQAVVCLHNGWPLTSSAFV